MESFNPNKPFLLRIFSYLLISTCRQFNAPLRPDWCVLREHNTAKFVRTTAELRYNHTIIVLENALWHSSYCAGQRWRDIFHLRNQIGVFGFSNYCHTILTLLPFQKINILGQNFRHFVKFRACYSPRGYFNIIQLWRHKCANIWLAIWLWRHNKKYANRCDVGPFAKVQILCFETKSWHITFVFFLLSHFFFYFQTCWIRPWEVTRLNQQLGEIDMMRENLVHLTLSISSPLWTTEMKREMTRVWNNVWKYSAVMAGKYLSY